MLNDNLNDEETVAAVDYFVVALLDVIEEIKQNGLITELCRCSEVNSRIVGKLDISKQVSKNPAYDKFYIEKTISTTNIIINQVIKTAIIKAKEVSKLGWVLSLLNGSEQFFRQ